MLHFRVLFPWCLVIHIAAGLVAGQCENPSITLHPKDPEQGFGFSVATDGLRTIIGGPNSEFEKACGSAFVYRVENKSWIQEQELVPWDEDCENFGYLAQVDISNDVAVVAAQLQGFLWVYGAVYVYRKVDDQWVAEEKLISSEVHSYDAFEPIPVDIDGDTLLVGEWWATGYGAEVFRHNGDQWVLEQRLEPEESTSSWVGKSVALDGDTALVSAFDERVNDISSGAVWVFRREDSAWVEEQRLTPSDGTFLSFFGWGLALQGDTAFINAPGDPDSSGDYFHGAVYVYRFNGSEWVEEQTLELQTDTVKFSSSVALSGDLALAADHLYFFDGAAWQLDGRLSASDGTYLGDFFNPVAFSYSSAFIGTSYTGNSVVAFDIGCLRPPCPGDANGDGLIDPLDTGWVLARLGCLVGAGDAECDAADQNGDGVVDPLDSGYVLSRFGDCP